MDKIQIAYFVEDRAQERFIRALVEKVAWAESIPSSRLQHDVRSARGGSRVVGEFEDFAADWEHGDQAVPHLVVVAVDGNCKRRSARVKELLTRVKDTNPLRDRIAFAVPEPYIERWYLLDPRAFKEGTGATRSPTLPPTPRKCKKGGHYKALLSKALRDGGVSSLLGGPEFAERIVENIDLDMLARQNAGFAEFLKGLRSLFKRLRPPI